MRNYIIINLVFSGVKSPFAFIHLIRIAAQLLEEQPDRTFLFDFIESCLRNKHEMVVYEAASAIVNMKARFQSSTLHYNRLRHDHVF